MCGRHRALRARVGDRVALRRARRALPREVRGGAERRWDTVDARSSARLVRGGPPGADVSGRAAEAGTAWQGWLFKSDHFLLTF